MRRYYWTIDGTKVSYVNTENPEEAYSIDFCYEHFLKINGRLYAKDDTDYYPLNCGGDPLPIGDLRGMVAAGNTVLQLAHGNAKPIEAKRYFFEAENHLLCLDDYVYVLNGSAYCRSNCTTVVSTSGVRWEVSYAGRIYLFLLVNGKKQFVRSFERYYPNGLYLDKNQAWQIIDGKLVRINFRDDCYIVHYDKEKDKLIFYCESDNGEQGKEDYAYEYINRDGRYVPA